MISLNEAKTGTIINYNDKLYQIVWSEHSKVGRGGAILRSRIKDLNTGAIIDKTFKGSERLDNVDLDRKKYQYLYSDDDNFYFMDPHNFEQISIDKEKVGELKKYLTEGADVDILLHDGTPLSLNLPIKMQFEITYTEPGVKGDTKSSTSLKPAQIQTGATVMVPLFIKQGEKIIVNTQTGQYVERA